MHENDQNSQDILQQSQDNVSYSNIEDQTVDPVSGSDSDNTASDAVTGDSVSGTVEDSTFEEVPHQDISFNVALLFVVSMIVGLLIFSSLSRKWHA